MEKVKLTEQQIQEYLDKYKDYLKESPTEYIRYFFKLENSTISIYKNGNLLIQGDLKQKEKEDDIYTYDLFDSIGADEVGTGDSFGPIVCAACFLKQDQVQKIKSMGAKDSKKLSEDKIKEIGKYIKDNLSYKVSVLNNETYNQITDNYNMNAIKAVLHNDNILNLSKITNPTYIVLDEFVNKHKYFEYLKNREIVSNINFETKGESKSLAVACASILARYIFLEEIDKMEKEYNLEIPKGSGEEAQLLINKLKKENPSILNKIAKLNFKNVSEN